MTTIQKQLKDLLSIDEKTSATIFITLFVFILGIIITQSVRIYLEYRERRHFRKLFRLNLIELLKKVRVQSDIYRKNAALLRIESIGKITLKKKDISQVQTLNKIGHKETFNAFFNGIENWPNNQDKYRRAFNCIWDALYSLEYWQDINLDKFNQDFAELNNKRNIVIAEYMDLIDSSLINANLKNEDPRVAEYHLKLQDLHRTWQNLQNRKNQTVFHRHIVVKNKILNNDFPDLEIPLIFKTNKLLNQAVLNYLNLKALMKANEYKIMNLYYVYRKGGRLINVSMNIIEENKRVKIWNLIKNKFIKSKRKVIRF